jgi:putative tricarboxylic transport membrane protein
MTRQTILGTNLRTSRFAAEIAVAVVTAFAGLATIAGALDFGIGWDQGGPQPGAFPFYVGLIVVAASLGNLVNAIRKGDRGAVFIDGVQARRVALFLGPVVLFVIAAVWVGLYVATALYLGAVMRLQGGYRVVTSIAVAIATSVFFYIVLEMWFRVPLLKGPLEAALGIH